MKESSDSQQPRSPTTTAEQNLTTHGQRRINLIWEITQAIIAVVVTLGTLAISAAMVLRGSDSSATAFLLLSNAFFMIVTSYFQRTNHTRTGGVQHPTKGDEEQR